MSLVEIIFVPTSDRTCHIIVNLREDSRALNERSARCHHWDNVTKDALQFYCGMAEEKVRKLEVNADKRRIMTKETLESLVKLFSYLSKALKKERD